MFRLPRTPTLSHRASSNIMPHVLYDGEETQASNYSSTSRQLHPATSNSTLRSHYDAKNSPLYISQQTSDSAVRDMALRKGKPQIGLQSHVPAPSPLARGSEEVPSGEHRRGKPAKLDLSKLFPKPRGHGGQEFGAALLSPNKLVNSPTAMSTVSDYFPHPMTREPTPQPRERAKLTKPQRQHISSTQPVNSTSPARLHKPDAYDSAKINVRRPPRGIQHWFEGLSEDSDDLDDDDEQVRIHEPAAISPPRHYPKPMKTSQNTDLQGIPAQKQQSRPFQYLPDPRVPRQLYANPSSHRFNSPSSFSVHSESSLGTARTKESAFSKSNLQNSSILSFSSSEDEGENNPSRVPRRKASVRDSIDMSESGDIIIGQAQAFEVRPPFHSRRPSAGKLSLISTSTNAATIDIMYTPEPPYTPMARNSISSRRTSHTRQPSVIPEVEDIRPKTSHFQSQSPSARSTRTSKSEPRSQEEVRKFMAVTPEEEALLEALRKKRAAMAQDVTKDHETTSKPEEVRQRTLPAKFIKKDYRAPEFLVAENPIISPVRIVETKKRTSRKSLTPGSLPSLVSSRGRTTATHETHFGSSVLRDSSSCDPDSIRGVPAFTHPMSKPLLSPPEVSPLDLFPSPGVTPTTSAASPTTTDHPSPIPSPVTPRGRHGDDVDVKVASSVPSWNGDTEDITILETGVIDPPAGSIKAEETQPNLQRRRTASSGDGVPFSLPTKYQSGESRSLASFTEPSSRPPSTTEPSDHLPNVPKKSALRNPSLSITTTGLSKTRHSNIVSTRTSSPNRVGHQERRSRHISNAGSFTSMSSKASIKRDSVAVGTASTRCSVSEDVLAAWGSLGGMRDYDTARY